MSVVVPSSAAVASVQASTPAGSPALDGALPRTAAPDSVPASADARSRAVKAAAAYVAGRPAGLHAGKDDGFVQLPVQSSLGWLYVPYERTYRGLPVVGGDFVVVVDPSGAVSSVSVAQTATIRDVATTPGIGQAAAEKNASARLTSAAKVEGTHLVIDARGAKPSLAWESTVAGSGADNAELTVDVDATTGAVLESRDGVEHITGDVASGYNGPVTIETTRSGGAYWLSDPVEHGLSCGPLATGFPFTKSVNSWGDGSDTTLETGCADVIYAAQTETSMVSAWLGRNGLDGNGGAWPIDVSTAISSSDTSYRTQDGAPYLLIGPDCDCGAGSGVAASLDVVGHENGHGIDAHTPGGMSGGNTKEFIADVFGTATEWYANRPAPYDTPDWTVGDSVYAPTGQRKMCCPSWGTFGGDPGGPDLYCYSSATLSLDPHLAAGIGDRWFYLLANGTGTAGDPGYGSPCDHSTFGGVGLVSALKILYSAMLMKTSASSYLNYRSWTLQAAKNLFPNDCSIFNRVRAAWNAVGVPPQPGEPGLCPMYATVVAGDFTGDGKTDMALTGKDFASIPVASSNGDGTFGLVNGVSPDFAGWARVAGVRNITGDFNGDGRTDIALVGGVGWASVPVAMSRGDGTFSVTDSTQLDFAGWAQAPGVRMITGDFNKDGKTDIALIAGPNEPTWASIPVALSNGDGSFRVTNLAASTFVGWAKTPGVQVLSGDFNGDGRTDLVLLPTPGMSGFWAMPVALSNGDGSFTATANYSWDFAPWSETAGVRAVTGDFNHDGRTDLALTGGSGWGSIPVAFANGDGTFSVTNATVPNFPGWAQVSGVRVIAGDFNGDGRTDIALTGGSGWSSIPVAFSNGDGSFGVTNAYVGGYGWWVTINPVQVIPGDFNGDGRIDIALTGVRGWGSVPIALSIGNGAFTITNITTAATISFGDWAAPTILAVPNLFEQNPATGLQALQNAGLVAYRQPDINVSDSSDGGKIVWQSPTAGTPVSPGAVVQYAIGHWTGGHP